MEADQGVREEGEVVGPEGAGDREATAAVLEPEAPAGSDQPEVLAGEVMEPESGEPEPEEEDALPEQNLAELLRLADLRADESHNAYLRALAEMDNIRKRTNREVDHARKFALEGFSRDLLSVADNMDRALSAVPSPGQGGGEAAFQSVVQGVRMVQSELNRVFNRHGITRMQVMNSRFDPNVHQAMMEVEDPLAVPGTVVRELQSGYLLHERLLRPALVGVAKG